MSDFLDRISKLSPKRLALLALELHEQVEAAKSKGREPIAIVGLGCRFPGGADGPDKYWALLREGRDAIGEVPRERWDIDAYFDPDVDAPGRISVRTGGFLGEVGGFDAAFFGISPREALTMDPQQRLLLEVAWEALEHAGLSPEKLAGSATGVFVGVCNSDHFQRVLKRGDDAIDMYIASGNAPSVTAGRISYCLGLQGPAMAVDTACSSSLVALNLACQSLRRGDSRVALAAGVNVMCSPETTIALSQAHMLAPDGRCKTFDASADGFARGEGCGVLVLKRLADAQADGDRILAVIRGTAVNQDGRSGGLTVPNGPAQEAVIRAALADGGVAPADVGYVEAHGTGTSLGDPIEVRALAGALGPGRDRADPLVIGSVKTNFGHLESAAGVAGVMKVVLSLLHERIPPHLHFREPSPHIAWGEYPVTVLPQGREWKRGARPRLAGVSSFGFSGTNAHVVIEEAPLPAPAAAKAARPLHCLPLSARTPDALRTLAKRWADTMASSKDAALDFAHTAAAGRSHLGERVAVVGDTPASLASALGDFCAGRENAAVHRGQAVPGQAPEVVFLFTGPGSPYPGMARALCDGSPVFRDVIDRCDAALGADARGRTLKSVLWASDAGDASPIHETGWTQPALFAVEYGLAQLWRSWGVEPAAAMGHSAGEYVAACVAGVFTLEEGIVLIAERGRLMQALPPGGTMAAIYADAAEVERAVAPYAGRVAIAAINAADSVVISGEATAIESIVADFERRNVKGHRLYISLAAHSPLVEPALDAMEAAAARVTMQAPKIPVAWNVTGGEPLPGGAPDARYWRRHLREAVRFADGVKRMHRDGYRVFLEVGPHPTLLALAQRSLPEEGVRLLGSLRRGKDDWSELLASVAELHVHGTPIDWKAFDAPYAARPLPLPTYPFEHKRYWITPEAAKARRATRAGSPLLPTRAPVAAAIYETTLTPESPAWLGEHRVLGAALVAGPVFLELAQAAARAQSGARARSVADFAIADPLVLPDDGRVVQVQLDEEADGLRFRVHSRDVEGEGEWTLHATGRLVEKASPLAAAPTLAALEQALGAPQECAGHYDALARLGIDLRAGFRTLRRSRRRDGEALAWIELPAGANEPATWAHPVLLDGALQSVGLAVPPAQGPDDLYLLTGVEAIELAGALPRACWAHARVRPAADARPAEWRADVTLRDAAGAVLGTLQGVTLRRATRAALERATGGAKGAAGLYYRVEWDRAPVSPRAAAALESPVHFVPRLRERFPALAREHDLAIYAELLPELDRLAVEHVAAALRELGFDATPGRAFEADAEAARLKVVPRHRRLFGRVLDMLAEEGVLVRDGRGYRVAKALPAGDPRARYDALLARFGRVDGELSTLRRCGPELARVLDGRQDPLQLLFPEGSFAEARSLYVESPFARTYNNALAEAVTAAIARLPAGAKLRVLEIGAGTGGTTHYVLPRLPADRSEYTFTDLSPLFLERAAEQFAAYPFVKRALLDIERDPATQGFEAGGYDLVIAANVLHATADLRQALTHARDLLAPGGQLLLLEGVEPERWVDLTFGLTEGWWRFTDTDLRPAYPLVARGAWREVLAGLNFADIAVLPEGAALARGPSQQALVIARAPAPPRHWMLVGDGAGVAAALASKLEAGGDRVTRLAADAVASTAPLAQAQLVWLGALDIVVRDEMQAAAASESLACTRPLEWLAALARAPGNGKAWLATRGAQAVDGGLAPAGRWQAPLWGVGRVFALEQPARWGGLVDLPVDADPEALAAALVATFHAGDREDQVAWRNGERHVARLRPSAAPAAQPIALRADATYLVTGGFGGLGLLAGRWLAERGARHVALMGRRPDPDHEGVRGIEALGAKVIALTADVGDAAQLDAALAKLDASAPRLAGVLHAAADLDVAPITALTPAQVARMLRPKVAGTVLLERAARDRKVDFIALYSSTTALLGASGFAHYAAANAFLDASAQSASGVRELSVNWGTWEAMRNVSAEGRQSYREAGLEPMPAAEALEALGRLLAGNTAQAAVARIDWNVLKPLHEARGARPLLADLGGEPEVAANAAARASASSWLDRIAAAAEEQRIDILLELVRAEVAMVLGRDENEPVPPDAGLFELGMDSLMSVELKRRLERGAGRKLPSTLTFNYPNAAALAAFLAQEMRPATSSAATAPVAPAPAPATQSAVQEGDVSVLSDEELEARLMARLEQVKTP